MNESFIKISRTFVTSKVDPGLELQNALIQPHSMKLFKTYVTLEHLQLDVFISLQETVSYQGNCLLPIYFTPISLYPHSTLYIYIYIYIYIYSLIYKHLFSTIQISEEFVLSEYPVTVSCYSTEIRLLFNQREDNLGLVGEAVLIN